MSSFSNNERSYTEKDGWLNFVRLAYIYRTTEERNTGWYDDRTIWISNDGKSGTEHEKGGYDYRKDSVNNCSYRKK